PHEVAPCRLLPTNRRAKQALVTDVAPAPRLEDTPADPPMPSLAETTIDGSLDAAGTLSARGVHAFRGDLELPLRMTFRMVPAARWQELVERVVKGAGIDAEGTQGSGSGPPGTHEALTDRLPVQSSPV